MISIFNAETGETIERELTQDEIDDLASIVVPSLSYRIGKSTPWRRMTDTEATDVAGAIKQQSIKNQMIYDAASYIDSGDPLFSMLRQLLVAVVGETRADELLAPEVVDVNQP